MTGVSLSNVIAETLIREFLKSHNYASSIESLAKESILNKHHNVPKITSRAELSKLLGVTKLVKLNKESGEEISIFLK